jgi:predicted amidohydrolase YtcJ/regulation of enolase protein 1 (concanavalin A-like superfamily)
MFSLKTACLAFTTFLSLVVLAVGCGPQPVAPSSTTGLAENLTPPPTGLTEATKLVPGQTAITQAPAVIFYNGSVLTMDVDLPAAEAIALDGERILAVGSNEDILALQGTGTQAVDLQGSTLMPGFVDPHTHIFNDSARFLGRNDLQLAQQLALRNGITTVGDLWVDPGFLAAMQAMESSGQLRVRTSLYLAYTNSCGELMGDWYLQYPPTREDGEMLRIGGVKIYADGGTCGGWARSYELPDVGYGDLWFTQDEMNAMVGSLDAAGYQLAIHALGDRAVEQVLNAYEFVLGGQPNTLRHRIEHNATLRPDLVSRYSEIGVVATVFGSYPTCIVEASPPPPERINDWEWPYRDLLLANPDLHIAWHSDYPWIGPVSPLWHLYSMVTPYSIFTDDGTECADPGWWTGRTFTVDEVLPMMTIEGAYALFRDEEVGSLEPGKFADMIVLSGDPTAIDPLDIRELEVWMTMVGGKVEWCAPGHEALCPLPLSTNPVPASIPAPLAVFQDDFSGSLQPGWTWVDGDDTLWDLTSQPGFLRMELESDFQSSDLLVRDVGSDNFQITTHLLFTPASNYQFAGLIIYQDDGTKIQLGRAYCGQQNACVGNGIYFDALDNSQPRAENFATETKLVDEAYLRIYKEGSLLTGYYSEDGASWSLIGQHEVSMTDPLVGLIAGQSYETGAAALFDNFTLVEMP